MTVSSKALYGGVAGIEMAMSLNSAFQEQAYAQLQSDMMQRQMDEIESRTQIEIYNINKSSEKVVANQQAAFIMGGVELSGSAMNVISDTMNDAAEAAYIRQRETDYEMVSSTMEKTAFDRAASTEAFTLKMLAAGLGSATGYAKNMAAHNKGAGPKKAKSMFTDTVDDFKATDSNGGRGISAMNYTVGASSAQGIA